ncbi:hypothetical protein GH714_006537 [Hevea brasiliensis]|uniref:DUF4220 domain-containing protein n=1 Tax=Hevea brasiliensis TaxID=3981 RepID=A0A6A6N7E3_HEVBR|nr:hypothetical protein GH714_006537 [Hevea brasiliensis]
MFIVAIIKCGERTWALRFASTDQFRKSMLHRPDPGHSYAKFMDNYASLIAEGYNVSLEPVIDEASIVLGQSCKAVENSIVPDAAILHDAAYCFKTFKRFDITLAKQAQNLLVDLIYKTICYIQSWLQPFYITPSVNKRWSNCIAKFNLIRVCLDDKPIMFSGIFRFLCIYEMLEKRHFKVLDAVSPDLKKLVFEQLLVKSRNELDISISRQLCAQRGDQDISDENKACTALHEVNTDILPSQVKGDRSKSVLFDASRLAKSLQSLETEEQWTSEKKWEMINRVWIEMLSYAANQCGSNNHAKQLTGGGELLTHVWLLMAHLGITEQFQISKGNARVKLVVS